MNVAAVLAGGCGTRFGADLPKQFLPVNGIPIVIRSVSVLVNSPEIDLCVVSVRKEYISYTRRLIDGFLSSDKEIYVISGGETRGETLLSVLEFMRKKDILNGSFVLTHDAVRPFVTASIIHDSLAAAALYGASGACVPAVDTVLLSGDGVFTDTVPERRTVFHAQTPQTFDAGLLYELISRLEPETFRSMTDGCSVFMYFGRRVALVPGDRNNIKITYPEDMERARYIAREYFDRTE